MRINQTRERLARGETVYGCGLQVYRSAEIPRTFAAAGFRLRVHRYGTRRLRSGNRAGTMIRASVEAGITPIVRWRSCCTRWWRGCWMRPQGIILPRVEDQRVLAEALSWLRFPPRAKRGYGGPIPP